jgi:hypothetical protein
MVALKVLEDKTVVRQLLAGMNDQILINLLDEVCLMYLEHACLNRIYNIKP